MISSSRRKRPLPPSSSSSIGPDGTTSHTSSACTSLQGSPVITGGHHHQVGSSSTAPVRSTSGGFTVHHHAIGLERSFCTPSPSGSDLTRGSSVRSVATDQPSCHKKRRIGFSSSADDEKLPMETSIKEVFAVKSVYEALRILRESFPVNHFPNELPAINWKHMLYSLPLIGSRTDIDRKIVELCQKGLIRLFTIGLTNTPESVAIIFMSDYEKVMRRKVSSSRLTDRFFEMMRRTPDPVIKKDDLKDFTASEITELVTIGVLALNRLVGTWQLSIPGAGTFIKCHRLGRNTLIRTLKSSKFKEMSRSELETRRLPKNTRLSVDYFIIDLIGSGIVQSVPSPTGDIIRLL